MQKEPSHDHSHQPTAFSARCCCRIRGSDAQSGIDGLRREWLEAAENLGASSFQYWRYVAFPILLPAILGTMILLFGNAFGAFATAQALTGGQINLVTIVIGAQLRGDVLADPGLGYALSLGMVVIMAVAIVLRTVLQRRTERWLR